MSKAFIVRLSNQCTHQSEQQVCYYFEQWLLLVAATAGELHETKFNCEVVKARTRCLSGVKLSCVERCVKISFLLRERARREFDILGDGLIFYLNIFAQSAIFQREKNISPSKMWAFVHVLRPTKGLCAIQHSTYPLKFEYWQSMRSYYRRNRNRSRCELFPRELWRFCCFAKCMLCCWRNQKKKENE